MISYFDYDYALTSILGLALRGHYPNRPRGTNIMGFGSHTLVSMGYLASSFIEVHNVSVISELSGFIHSCSTLQ
jgi:hypothetical protein